VAIHDQKLEVCLDPSIDARGCAAGLFAVRGGGCWGWRMKFRRFSDIPLFYKIAAAPFFTLVILFAVVTGAALMQERQTLVMRDIIHNSTLQSALAADSEKITADNGALFLIMDRQRAVRCRIAGRR
jgi:hypothetical protein